MFQLWTFAPLLFGLANALPQQQSQSCVTVSTEIIVPTTTYTFQSTHVITTQATTAEDLGTYTLVDRVSSTKTLTTLTTTATDCTAQGTITAQPTETVYTVAAASPQSYAKRQEPSACTVTAASTTTYGATETYVDSGKTSTYTKYTSFTQTTTTTTSYGGVTYFIATATATTSALCGPTVNATYPTATQTVTQDSRCAPTALVSEYKGYGLEYGEEATLGGTAYQTTASDASECCQLCAETKNCAASRWDIRNNVCRLSFPVQSDTGAPSCSAPLLMFYDAGPDHPMAPGTGWYVGTICGQVQYASAQPDDGT